MKFAIVVVPAAPVRKKAHHKYEMVNQLLFGEKVEILSNKKNEWYKVKSLYDGYKGWVTHHMLKEISQQEAIGEKRAVTQELLSAINVNGMVMQLPMGSFLWNIKKDKGIIAGWNYEYGGKPANKGATPAAHQKIIKKQAQLLLNAPYMWGGKTIMGIDCSGFAQTVFKVAGIRLKRDAWQQAQHGRLVKALADAAPGDLAFFDDKNEIVHVGILLGPDKIIHASGKVRIDPIDEKGIINGDSGKRTHRLKLIRRMPELITDQDTAIG